jgi:uncharacterized protein YjdB
VSSISVEPDNVSVEIGSTAALTATVAPDDATDPSITWSSSDESVATVDANGLVTAVAVGTATITATAADGSGVSDSATVTVRPLAVISAVASASVTKLTGNSNNLTVTVTETLSNGTTNVITATVLIANNAAGTYQVGPYQVYVDTKGVTQVRGVTITS